MNTFLQLLPQERALAFQQVQAKMGLQAFSVEKDFWVCWTLRELFSLPEIGCHLTFKGGTSLSKAWGYIRRFSEDIDIIVDKNPLGFAGDENPEKAASKKQRRMRMEELMDACKTWVQRTLLPALQTRFQESLGQVEWRLEVDPDISDGQCLLFHYPSVFPAGTAGYVRQVVKIELGARSDDWPHEVREIQPYVIEAFPAFEPNGAGKFRVQVLTAERTFWEKACLLHEETFRPIEKVRPMRMSRHYYDLWCMIQAGVGQQALASPDLFARVVEHRRVFFAYTWVDYETHRAGAFKLLPPEGHLPSWQDDYAAMRTTMFFEDPPDFDTLMAAAQRFVDAFNATGLSDPMNEFQETQTAANLKR